MWFLWHWLEIFLSFEIHSCIRNNHQDVSQGVCELKNCFEEGKSQNLLSGSSCFGSAQLSFVSQYNCMWMHTSAAFALHAGPRSVVYRKNLLLGDGNRSDSEKLALCHWNQPKGTMEKMVLWPLFWLNLQWTWHSLAPFIFLKRSFTCLTFTSCTFHCKCYLFFFFFFKPSFKMSHSVPFFMFPIFDLLLRFAGA